MKNLASERIRLGLTQEQLAEKLGTNTRSINHYENGKLLMPPQVLGAAADLFGCSTDYLLGRTNDRLPRTPKAR